MTAKSEGIAECVSKIFLVWLFAVIQIDLLIRCRITNRFVDVTFL